MTTTVATPSTGTRTGAVLALACAAQFVVVLDVAVVNVALPSIRADLGLSADALHWVVVAYSLLLGSFLLLGGRICDTFGRRTALILGLVVFTLASVGAGAAPNETVLLAARAVQGLGAALIPPAALATIAITFNDQAARSRALGLYGAVTGMSASVGVLASGLITENLGWRWVFLVNLPIGISLAVAAAALLPRERPRVGPRGNGIASSLAVSAGIFLLIFGLSEGSTHGWLRIESVASLLAALLLLAYFGWLQGRDPTPLVPHEIRRRAVLSAAATAFFLFAALLAFIFLGSLLMQQLLAYSSATTGLGWLAMTATSFIAAALTGTKLLPLVGIRPLIVIGLVLLAAAAVVAGFTGADAHYATGVMPALILAGTAGGLSAPAVQLGALTGVPDHAAGVASGLLETMRDLGGSVGIAAVATALASAGNLDTQLADAFRHAYWIVAALALAGAVTALTTFRPHTINPKDAR
jgi:EmrB/QacA subfamily drug resistance transporter